MVAFFKPLYLMVVFLMQRKNTDNEITGKKSVSVELKHTHHYGVRETNKVILDIITRN